MLKLGKRSLVVKLQISIFVDDPVYLFYLINCCISVVWKNQWLSATISVTQAVLILENSVSFKHCCTDLLMY